MALCRASNAAQQLASSSSVGESSKEGRQVDAWEDLTQQLTLADGRQVSWQAVLVARVSQQALRRAPPQLGSLLRLLNMSCVVAVDGAASHA